MPLVETISSKDVASRALYAIGDVHGCLDELRELETKIEVSCKRSKKKPLFILAGDLCDRGAHSKEVIEHVRCGVEAGTHKTVLGNHDIYFLQFADPGTTRELSRSWPPWLDTLEGSFRNHWMHAKGHVGLADYEQYSRIHWAANGGITCIQSYGGKSTADDFGSYVPKEHIEFLLQCPILIDTPFGSVTHAWGRSDDLELLRRSQDGDPVPLDILRASVNRCAWSRKKPKTPPAGLNWHFSGHTPLDRVKRSAKNRWMQIDTACVYGNTLSAVHMETRRVVSVPSRQIRQS